MKTRTNKNTIIFKSKEELEQYVKNNELVWHASVGSYYGCCSYINHHTYINDGYIYNFYVCQSHCILIKHPKLKIYHQENGGYYVLSQGIRCWINSFWDRKNEVFITGEQVIETVKRERGI